MLCSLRKPRDFCIGGRPREPDPRSRREWALAAVMAVVCLCWSAAPVRADFILGFAGNTQPTHAGFGVQGFIDAAVFNHTNGVAGDTFHLGIANIDTVLTNAGFNINSQFLYLYQSANSGTVGISSTTIFWEKNLNTGFGFLSGLGFHDAGGNISATHSLGTPAAPGDPSPWSANGANVTLTNQGAGLLDPHSVVGLSASLKANFDLVELAPGVTSSVFGFTSNQQPALSTGSQQDGGTTADGTPPSMATPEPPTALLALVALPGLGIWVWRRRYTAG